MSGVGGSAQQPLLMVLAVSALRSVEDLETPGRSSADEHRWVDLAHYLTRGDAVAALDRVVEHAHADRHELRVEHVRRRPA